MKKPDLLILIAIWEFLAGFLALSAIIAVVLFVFPFSIGYWDYTYTEWSVDIGLAVVFGIIALVIVAYVALSVLAGIGLLMGKEWGRIASIVHSALSLFSVPIGTIIGVLSIIYLTKPEVKDYFTAVNATVVSPDVEEQH